jgi:hypothetical protein
MDGVMRLRHRPGGWLRRVCHAVVDPQYTTQQVTAQAAFSGGGGRWEDPWGLGLVLRCAVT